MNFLDRNTLPKFQERLDLAASELNNMEDIFTASINELAGRIYIINNMINDPEERAKYSSEPNFLILDKITSMQSKITSLREDFTALTERYDAAIEEQNTKYLELEERLNALDDAAARKEKDIVKILIEFN